jgi:CheY-like chemotaxis protein
LPLILKERNMTAMLGLMSDRPVSALFVESDWKASLERAEVLVRRGWSVSVSVSAEDALARLEGSLPDVVLTDLALSGEMTGLDLARRVKRDARTRYVPVIALTSLALTEIEEAASNAGCTSCLEIPCSVDAVIEAVTNAIVIADLLAFRRGSVTERREAVRRCN